MVHAVEDFARYVERIALARALGDFDREAAVAGADFEEYRFRFDEPGEQRNAIRYAGTLLGLGDLAGEL